MFSMSMLQLRAFDAVVAEGGIGAAARALGVSQPTVSAQLRALEQQHGVRLVERSTGEPTAVGERLREVTAPMIALERAARAVLTEAEGSGDGVFTVAADAPSHLMPVLRWLRPAFPHTVFEVRAMNSSTSLRAVEAGEVDLAIAADVPEAPTLHRRELQRQDLAAVLPVDHPLARGKTLPLAALASETIVAREEGSRTRAALTRAARAQGVALRHAVVADDRETMLAAVISGFGIGILAENEMIDDPRIVMLDLRRPTISLTEHLVCAAHRREEPLLRAAFAVAGG